MAFELDTLGGLDEAGFDAIIDVRSPSEFAEDHVPGAINLPVLSDEERAHVGTIYVQDSPFKARKIGAALVARNAASHLDEALADHAGGWRPLVYCWRGGQRSGSFASILSQIGWRAETLVGGYQTYRRLVVKALYENAFPAPVVLLDGNTGTAKTDVLKQLAVEGVQVIDLEGLANHRGSALGAQGEQPSQKAFESRLAAEIVSLDPEVPVVIEAESSRIGRVNLPPMLFDAMKTAPRFEITAPVEARAAYLVGAYADVIANKAALTGRLDRLVKLQGYERVNRWKAMVASGSHLELAQALIEHHYDPRYCKSRERRDVPITKISTQTLDSDGISALAGQIRQRIQGSSADGMIGKN